MNAPRMAAPPKQPPPRPATAARAAPGGDGSLSPGRGFSLRAEDYDVTRLPCPRGGPSWAIDPARSALLVHDMQPPYVDVLSPRSRRRLLERVQRVVDWADAWGVPLLASGPRAAAEPAQRGLLGSCWGIGLLPEQAAATTLPRLAAADVTRIAKRSYSAFHASDLETELRRRGRDQLVIVGVYASHGILATSVDAIGRDVRAFVPFDATADYTAGRHAAALELIGTMSGRVLGVGDLLREAPVRRSV
ncbi:isochorismatase family protein [Streptomyces sp. NBC_01264]|uniref:isochorismatase family protein n=1 Tax=Streptomyces sp. NBC_01264 TaxID=2903804 RepID=UPI00224F9F4C|nr:isochorismatase family protein [Streptomyces sp. NBC_01264]MCX4781717.1 isochorismatase family protein [Streptomyces sp. NBC_01264]